MLLMQRLHRFYLLNCRSNTTLRFGCPPWATPLTRCSAALRLPPLGYTFDFPFYHGAIARVFLRLTCQALVAQRGGWRRLRIPIPRSARKILTCQDRRVKKRTCDSSHVECRIFSKIRHAHSAIRHQLSIFRFPPPRSPPLRASPFPVSHSRCLSVRFTQPPIKTET